MVLALGAAVEGLHDDIGQCYIEKEEEKEDGEDEQEFDEQDKQGTSSQGESVSLAELSLEVR